MTALFGPTDVVERAALLREAGASGVFTFEGPREVFTPLVLASTVKGLDLMTNVAIALPRNPIQLAHQANDLQEISEDVSSSVWARRSGPRSRNAMVLSSTGRWRGSKSWWQRYGPSSPPGTAESVWTSAASSTDTP